MRRLAKILIFILGICLILPVLPVKAEGNAVMILTSERTDYYLGETVYVDIEVQTNGEELNVTRAIMDFTGGDVLILEDFDPGEELPYVSPGSEWDNVTDHINVGTFILMDSVNIDFVSGTLIFQANQLGSSDIGKPFLEGSHLISPLQEEKINLAGCQGITINVIGAPPPPNHAPVFDPVANKVIELGQSVNFQVKASDPDNDNVNFVPAWQIPFEAIFENIIEGLPVATADFFWTPTSEGTYNLRFYATDDHATDPKTVSLQVQVTVQVPVPTPEVNRPPIFQPVSNKSIELGQSVNFLVRATDPDDDIVTLSWEIPPGAIFADVVSGTTATGNFSWTPTAEGVFTLIFVAQDNHLDDPKSTTLAVSIAVSVPLPPPNHAPVFEPIAEKTVNAGELLTFEVRATDPDGDNVILSMEPLETANFTMISSGPTAIGQFSWQPQIYGIYYILFDAVDDHPTNPLSKSQQVRITVFGGECPPCSGGPCPILTCEELEEYEEGDVLPGVLPPIINSPTHPDQALWYSNNKPKFSWEVEEEGLGFAFNLDENPAGYPAESYYFSQDKVFSFTEVADGFWYFHLKVQYEDGWGPTAHYRIKVDITPPEFFKPSIEADGTIYFSALDRHSGLDYYEMKIDNSSWQYVQSPYKLTEADRQGSIMSLRAVDNAGNAREVKIDVQNLVLLEEEEEIYEIEEEVLPVEEIEEVKTVQERVTDTLNLINENFFENTFVEQATQDLVTPALLAVAAVNTLPAAIAATLTVLPYLHLLFSEPFLWFFRRRRRKWGVVYDSLTKMPIDLAVIRLFKSDNDILVQTRISDKEGRYIMFIKEPGRYYLTVTMPGYTFPTRYLINQAHDGKYLDVYHGEEIEVTEEKGVITPNIPLDQIGKKPISNNLAIKRHLADKVRTIVSFTGIMLALFTVVVYPTVITIGALIFHLLLFMLFRRFVVPPKAKSWGIIYNKKTKEVLPRTIVKLFDMKFNKLLETQVTDSRGRYAFLVGKNTYQMMAEKNGFKKKLIKDIDLLHNERIVDLDIALEKDINQKINDKNNTNI